MSGWAAAIQAAISLYGQHAASGQLDQTTRRLRNMSRSGNAFGEGAFGSFENRQRPDSSVFRATEDPNSQQFRELLGSQGGQLLQGGLFNDPTFLGTFQSNDLGSAFGQAQGGNQVFQSPNAFGDFGGQVNNMFSQGNANLGRAGDVSGLVAQNLSASRALAEPFETDMRNNFFDSEFGKTLGATTGSGRRGAAFADSLFRADQNRVLGAQQLGQQQQQFFGNLGQQQIGQGFAGEGQGFQQQLQSLQQNQTAGQTRLGNAMGLFGLGRDTQQSQFGLGLQSQQANLAQNQFLQNMMLGLLNADANRIGAQSGFAQPIGQLGSNQSAQTGGFFSGLGGMFGGMDFGK